MSYFRQFKNCIPKLALEISDLLLPATVLLPRLDDSTQNSFVIATLLGCDFVRIYTVMHKRIRTGRNSVFKMVSSVFFISFFVFLLAHGILVYADRQIRR
jgi:hypothetical protein